MSQLRRRLQLVAGAALVTGAALFVWWRYGPNDAADGAAGKRDGPAAPESASAGNAALQGSHIARHVATGDVPALPARVEDASTMGTADIALALAAWPQGQRLAELSGWIELLAARGPAAIPALSSALTTAGTNTARGALADAMARIGSPEAIQELCVHAVNAETGAARGVIASSFRALSNPASAPVLATVLAETDDPIVVRETTGALTRLCDSAAVEALAGLCKEDGQLHSQRTILIEVVRNIKNPEAVPALEAVSFDASDSDLAAAAAAALANLRRGESTAAPGPAKR